MLWNEQELRRGMAATVDDLLSAPAPVDVVVRAGRARKRRRANVMGSAALVLAVLPAAAVGYALDYSRDHPGGGVGGPVVTPAAPGGATRPVAAPTPVPAKDGDQLVGRCIAQVGRSGAAAPVLSARTVAGDVVLVRVGQETLSCWSTGHYSVVAGSTSKVAVTGADTARPVRTVDAGGSWDGRAWTAVLHVTPNITSATVVVDGGTPQGLTVSAGWAVAAARPRAPRTAPSDAGNRKAQALNQPTVRLTAFDKDGHVVWSGTSEGGRFGWTSPTHPNH